MTDVDDKLRKIEGTRKTLDGATSEVGKRDYRQSYVNFNNFFEWAEPAAEVNDPDVARTVLYFGFQPLYDLLIDNEDLTPSNRTGAVKVLDAMMLRGTEYLAGYYSGNPQTKIVNDLGISTRASMKKIERFEFRTKRRNVDYNGISPKDILLFLQQFFDATLDGKVTVPNFVVGVACGPSEIAMPLAHFSEAGLGFIRQSKRRGDRSPRIIREHGSHLEKGIKDSHAIVLEDYVCTGASLALTMERVSTYSPRSLLGASINSMHPSSLREIASKQKFQLYTL